MKRVGHFFLFVMFLILAWGPISALEAKPVEQATFFEDTSFQPRVDVIQEIDESGRVRYSRIEQKSVRVVGHAFGRCGRVYRMRAAWVHSYYQEFDGSRSIPSMSVELSPPSFPEITDFTVNPDKRTFGPHFAQMDLPIAWLAEVLSKIGEDLVDTTAATLGITANELRRQDWGGLIDLPLAFFVACRAPAESPTKQWHKSTLGWFPLQVTFKGAENLVVSDPDSGSTPKIPEDGITTGVRIDGNSLIIVPEERPGSCRLHLSGTFRTSGATTVTYRLLDHLGAASPLQSVGVDQSGVAFVSHEVDLVEPDNQTLDLKLAVGAGNKRDDMKASGDLQQEPSTRIRGFYQIETIKPHRTKSNFAGFNLDECEAEEVLTPKAIGAFFIKPGRVTKGGGVDYSPKPSAR